MKENRKSRKEAIAYGNLLYDKKSISSSGRNMAF
jgi:hypothetical protein